MKCFAEEIPRASGHGHRAARELDMASSLVQLALFLCWLSGPSRLT
jgi:hypothetical protein